MKSTDYDYELPAELIAQSPAVRRSDARLLHLPAAGPVVHRTFRELPALLTPGDLLVLNETRVIPARLLARRASGGRVEVFLLRREEGAWRALVRPAQRVREGEELVVGDGELVLRVCEKVGGGEARIEFPRETSPDAWERHGQVPLPPYVRRSPTPEDRERYQTVFARVPGAVAAPTAGLHFDEEILAELAARGVGRATLVLHVGAGTFRPLPAGPLANVRLESEWFSIPVSTRRAVVETRRRGARIVACGTTVVRALESWALAGSPLEGSFAGDTDLFIRPRFEFRLVDALLTNFHLPRSSLLCLVAAFAGRERILAAYEEAIRQRYRFYSYGDATFLERAT